MIFASDLDRTLIYSKRALDEFGVPEGLLLVPVEQKDGDSVAFMTETSYLQLKELANQSLFVPVTTRTTEQFKRFVIFEKIFALNMQLLQMVPIFSIKGL